MEEISSLSNIIIGQLDYSVISPESSPIYEDVFGYHSEKLPLVYWPFVNINLRIILNSVADKGTQPTSSSGSKYSNPIRAFTVY